MNNWSVQISQENKLCGGDKPLNDDSADTSFYCDYESDFEVSPEVYIKFMEAQDVERQQEIEEAAYDFINDDL